jgi:(1->4)-alpha-D-glucan 1-alpha-D-glucosylmutase
LKPDIEYENAYVSFAEKILARSEANSFLKEFIPFCRRVSHFGIFNSLSQTLIKIASPGVPDLYQGAELWDLSLVDPDNRRPVDFEKRRAMLAGIREEENSNIDRLIRDLFSTREDGKIKLFLIYRALKAKNADREIFRSGSYLSLDSAGRFRNHVIAFAWRFQRQWALIIAPRFFSHLIQEGVLPLGRDVWQDTEVIKPDGAPDEWRNVITNEVLSADKTLYIGDILRSFPVAMLMGEGKEKYVQTT